MEAILMTKEHFNVLMTSMEEIKNQLKSGIKKPAESFIDNMEFMRLMNVSKRTAQTWRDEGKISFSQVGHKIYYKLSDIEELLNNHHFKAFKRKGAALNRI